MGRNKTRFYCISSIVCINKNDDTLLHDNNNDATLLQGIVIGYCHCYGRLATKCLFIVLIDVKQVQQI